MTGRGRALLLSATLLSSAAPARAQVNTMPPELAGIGIDDRPGALAPRDLRLTDHRGRPVRLGDYFDGQRPVVLVLAYYQCPMLCSMVLNGLSEGLKPLARDPAWIAGDRFRALTVSFDVRDTPAMAAAKRDNQLLDYGHPVSGTGWDFLVGDGASIAALTSAVGFHFRWDDKDKQFAHAAGAFVFSPDGRLSRTLYGIQFPATSLRLALVEASEGKQGTAWDRILLFCYHYDPAAKGYVLLARRVMAGAGVVTMFALLAFLAVLFRPTRKPSPVLPAPTERVV